MNDFCNIYNDPIKVINLETYLDKRGSLNVLEISEKLNFSVNRIYFTENVPNNSIRGNHSHVKSRQIIISIKGEIVFELFNGSQKKEYILDTNKVSLYVPPFIWSCQIKHSPDNIMMALSSHKFFKEDYINDFDEYMKIIKDIEKSKY